MDSRLESTRRTDFMKKFTALLMILMFAAVMCFANGGTESTDSQDIAGQTIEVAVNYTGIQSDVFNNLAPL